MSKNITVVRGKCWGTNFREFVAEIYQFPEPFDSIKLTFQVSHWIVSPLVPSSQSTSSPNRDKQQYTRSCWAVSHLTMYLLQWEVVVRWPPAAGNKEQDSEECRERMEIKLKWPKPNRLNQNAPPQWSNVTILSGGFVKKNPLWFILKECILGVLRIRVTGQYLRFLQQGVEKHIIQNMDTAQIPRVCDFLCESQWIERTC